mgnify:FL=1
MTSKQRAQLKAIAADTDAILQVGKGGVGETLVRQVADALKARELIKMTVLETTPAPAGQVAQELAAKTRAEVVQVIGRKIVLFKRNPQEPKIRFIK